MAAPSGSLTAILPCNDLDAAERFFNRLGFSRRSEESAAPDTYRMLANGKGGHIHLTDAVEGWLVPGRNPFGLYLYEEDVDAVAAAFKSEIIEQGAPHDKPWGMYEFAVSGPDDILVRIGWPSHLRKS